MTIRMSLIVHKEKRWIPFDENLFYRAIDKANSEITTDAFDLNSVLVPRLTGNLQESFGVQKEDGGRLMRFSWGASYAQFVNDGYPSSSGRFVEVIGKRLIQPSRRNPNIGVHPGYRGAHYMEAFADAIREAAKEEVVKAIAELISHE